MPADADNESHSESTPGLADHSSKPQVPLQPSWRSDRACKQLHRALLDTLLGNEQGARRGRDPEFLHDFRVSVRRIRAALGQVPEVYPPAAAAYFKQGFAWLGKMTGPARDLDVFLQQLPEHGAELDQLSPSGLEPLTKFLTQQQADAQDRIAAHLNSPRYLDLIRKWGEFLDLPTPRGEVEGAVNADRPVLELADERIHQAHRKLTRQGREIDSRSSPATLHRLRIRGKKLRYLLELFADLYPTTELLPLLDELKQLQQVLGTYNDLTVQRAYLDSLDDGLLQDDAGNASRTPIALLGDYLDRRSAAVRQSFDESFATFDRPATQERFKRLLRTQSD